MNYIEFESTRKNYGITMKEIAEELRISISTLYRWMNNMDYEKEEKILEAVENLKCLK